MKLKIVNFSKFIRSIMLIVGIIFIISLFINNKSFSYKENEFKEIYVSNGDTLWSIAKEEKENNPYYKNKDIRDIVNNIKSISKLNSGNLFANQKLIIPYNN